MNENIRLEDEELLFVGLDPARRIKILNDMGIFTVKDFLDTDEVVLLGLKTNGRTKNSFVVYHQILKYKYRGQKMVRDVYLDKEYHRGTSAPSDSKKYVLAKESLYVAIRDLGLYDQYIQHLNAHEFHKLYEQDQISMIEAIKLISQIVPKYKKLCDFYIEYYQKEIKKSPELDSNELDSLKNQLVELDSNELDSLKNQLVELVRQKAVLDSEIARLVEQVNTLEGGNITNGRK